MTRIVLYPHGERKPRVLEFKTNALNIITGDSGTGKSSIIDIVDYCLASSECRVADGVIRSNVAWYAIELLVDDTRVFIARRGPEVGRNASNDVFVTRDPAELPSAASLEPVTNVPGLEALLTELAGIPRTSDPESRLAPSYSATIRHASRLLYQNQNEISSPSLLFHREGDDFAKASIRDTLPFFLGAVSAEDLESARQLGDKRREMRRLQQQVKEHEELADVQGSRASNLVREGVDLGVLEVPADDLGRADAVAILNLVSIDQAGDREVDASRTSDRVSSRGQGLREQLRVLRDEYESVQEQIAVTRDFFEVRSSFGAAATDQLERLKLGAEVAGDSSEIHECPLCSSILDKSLPVHEDVVASLESLQQTVGTFSQDPPQLRALAEDLTARAADIRRQLVQTTGELESLEQEARRLRQVDDQRDQRLLWFGRLTLFLESVNEGTRLAELRLTLARLRTEIDELDARLGVAAVRERMASIVSRVSQAMTAAAAPLKLEWSAFPIRFDSLELTVIIDGPNGPIPLRRIGSGEAWVAYHMVTHLALHQQFASSGRPVPHMLFLDQPSQVYFPSETDAVTVAAERVGDMAAAERMLRVAFDATREENGFQVIMTEHAEIDEDWFESSLVENWREGRALIPADWL